LDPVTTALAPSQPTPAAAATARKDLSVAAQDRLRRYVLLGTGAMLFLNNGTSSALAVAGILDRDLLLAFLPGVIVGPLVWWLIVVRRNLSTAVSVFATYLCLNYGSMALQVTGWKLFATPWPLVPPLIGLYLGGRRLGAILTLAMTLCAVCAVTLRWLGVGLTTIVLPNLETPSGAMVSAMGAVIVLLHMLLFELSRARTQRDLDAALVELDAQEQTLKTLVESASDAILLLDTDYRVLAANAAAGRLAGALGGEKRELVGQSFLVLVAPATQALWRSRFEACSETARERMEDVVEVGGDQVHVETSIHRVMAADHLVGFTLFARDISERRHAEAALQRLRGQLLAASRHAGRAEVAAGVLHHVGNALNSINVSVGHVDAIAHELRIDGLRKTIDLLSSHAQAIESAMGARGQKALAFARALVDGLEGQRRELLAEAQNLHQRLGHVGTILAAQEKYAHARDVYEEIDLDELLRGALTLDEGWEGSAIDVGFQVAADARRIVSDKHKLLQILVTLLDNARDALRARTGDVREVRITAELRGDESVVLAVSDSGQGIAPEQRASIFSHGFTTKESGSGFALHSAALLASELGGRLTFESAGEGQGATFVLELPRDGARARAKRRELAA
jgi:PAS domain S-box-containing protein